MTAERSFDYSRDTSEEARRERLQDLGVGNGFEARLRTGAQDVALSQAMGQKILQSTELAPDVDTAIVPRYTRGEITTFRTREEQERWLELIEEQRAYFIESLMRDPKISRSLAEARSVKPYGLLPRRQDDRPSKAA